MVETITNIIGVTWLVYHVPSFIEELNFVLKKPIRVLLIPSKIISCLMCTSFWVCLVITKDITLASSVSVLGYLVDKYLISTDIKL
jgi:hypothetical protein